MRKPVPNRVALRDAIGDRDAATKRLDLAQRAEQRGRELMNGAEAKLAAFKDVDAAIVDFRAAKFKAAAAAGEGAPDNLSLPPALLARERDRDESRATVLAARAALQSLTAERGQAEKALKKAEQLASEAAHAILVEQAISQAAALAAAWSNVWHFADLLNALRGLSQPTQLPGDAVRLLHLIASIDHRQFPGGRNATLKRAAERWRMWHVALLRDATAEPPEFADDGASSAAVERVA